MALHHMVETAVLPIQTISFVDREAKSSCVQAIRAAFAAMEAFADLIDGTLDTNKTLFWAVTPQDRKFLCSQGKQVCHQTVDLGGHINYTRRFSNYTVRARIAKLRIFWDQLSRSCSPTEHN
jgi:hypothetical protein